jgi:nitrogen fixation NifU-like protein
LEVHKFSKELAKEELSFLEEAGYSREAIEFYVGKINVGVIENPDVALAYTGPCGDTIKLYLKIGKDNVIEEAKFQYLGCPASAACRSILT